jgi:nucleotide-binding universal stress UspA family protein
MSELTVLAGLDGSEPGFAALAFAIEFADRYDAALEAVHVTNGTTAATDRLLERAERELADAGVDVEPEVIVDQSLPGVGASAEVGDRLLDLIDERGYDHVAMGRNNGHRLERLVLGSCSKRVGARSPVPVTVVP